ncbi:MAG: hypothetical protein ACLTDX_19210 [[Clostridium] innocuum]
MQVHAATPAAGAAPVCKKHHLKVRHEELLLSFLTLADVIGIHASMRSPDPQLLHQLRVYIDLLLKQECIPDNTI